jgi:hypothetical protein
LDDSKKLLDFQIQLGKSDIQDRFSRMHHYIHGARQLRKVPSDSGPQTATNAVALHRAAQRLTHGETHARTRFVATVTVKHGDIPRKLFPALLVDRLKVCMPQQS